MAAVVAVVGSGPAALMAADVLAERGFRVRLFEKKKGPARKFLIAGASGLNITFDEEAASFHRHYRTSDPAFFESIFKSFSKSDWLDFVTEKLRVPTFKGTSRRYFVEGMKAAPLVRNWLRRLHEKGVSFEAEKKLVDFKLDDSGFELFFEDGSKWSGKAAVLALGGASYERNETPLHWPSIFKNMKIGFREFEPSNVGVNVKWPRKFLDESEGAALKNVVLETALGKRQGELVVTHYGLEGTPVYSIGAIGLATLDLCPDLSVEQLTTKLNSVRENLSPIRRLKKVLKLSEGVQSLVFHLASEDIRSSVAKLASALKAFPLEITGKQGIERAISSSGGVALDELDDKLMLKKIPGIFLAGEMLDWDTTTGGFLIQASVSTGFVAGTGVVSHLLVTK